MPWSKLQSSMQAAIHEPHAAPNNPHNNPIHCLQVIDLISLKPFDMETISKSIKKTRKVGLGRGGCMGQGLAGVQC